MTKRVLAGAAALLLLCLAQVAHAQQSLPARLRAYMDAHASIYGFSGAVLVRRGDRTLLRKAYGRADREWAVANTIDTRFRIASVSKPFTAVAIMRLVELGKLSLDDRLERFLPGFEGGDKITIRMLLNHTSGLPRGHDAEVALDMSMTHERALEIIRARPLAFEPGSRVGYSNTAFLLLSYIVEKASGESFGEFMEEQVFRPAGLRDTGIFDPKRILARRARGYRPMSWEPDAPAENEHWTNFAMFQGHGTLYSTVEDLARFLRLLRSTSLLTQASVDELLRSDPERRTPGLGFDLFPYFDRRSFGHGGSYNGARAFAVHLPDDDVTAVVLSNNNSNADAIGQALVGLALGKDVELPSRHARAAIEPSLLNGYAGRYGRGEFTISEGKLVAGPVELVPESRTRFFEADSPNITYEFVVGPDGRATALIFSNYGVKRTVPRSD